MLNTKQIKFTERFELSFPSFGPCRKSVAILSYENTNKLVHTCICILNNFNIWLN